jgi:hypothetical protein
MSFDEFLESAKQGLYTRYGQCTFMSAGKHPYKKDTVFYKANTPIGELLRLEICDGVFIQKDVDSLKVVYDKFSTYNYFYNLINGEMEIPNYDINNFYELDEHLIKHSGVIRSHYDSEKMWSGLPFKAPKNRTYYFTYKIVDVEYELRQIQKMSISYMQYHLFVNGVQMTKIQIGKNPSTRWLTELSYNRLFHIMVCRTEVERQLKLNELMSYEI